MGTIEIKAIQYTKNSYEVEIKFEFNGFVSIREFVVHVENNNYIIDGDIPTEFEKKMIKNKIIFN
jgi:hypothetical protein